MPVVRAVLAPVAVAVLMGGRRDCALVAADIAGCIRVVGVDVSGLVLDAFVPIRAVSVRAFVPVVRAILAPVTVAVLMGGRRGFVYRNRQLLLIVAHAVESSNGKLGGLFRSGRAADLAGGLFQRQAIGQLSTEKLPQNEASPSCLKLMVVRRADRAAGQRRGSNRRRILRT